MQYADPEFRMCRNVSGGTPSDLSDTGGTPSVGTSQEGVLCRTRSSRVGQSDHQAFAYGIGIPHKGLDRGIEALPRLQL
jgi:hypothetical protein